jgi:hypothetical protein
MTGTASSPRLDGWPRDFRAFTATKIRPAQTFDFAAFLLRQFSLVMAGAGPPPTTSSIKGGPATPHRHAGESL